MMTTILLGVFFFIAIVVALVVVLVVAKSKLINTDEVTILINGDPDNSVKVPAGDTLLNALSAQKIFIPSACGGGGTCGAQVAGTNSCDFVLNYNILG